MRRRSAGLQVPRPVGCSQSRGSLVGGVESRTGMCVPDHASAELVRDKKTRRHYSCGSPTPNLRRYTCGKHATSVTLVDCGAGQVRRTVIRTSPQTTCARTHALRASLDLWKRWCSGMRNARSLCVFCALQIIDRPRANRLHGSQYDLTGNVSCALHVWLGTNVIFAMLNMQCLNKTEGDTGGCLWDAFEHMEFCGHCSVMRFSTADSAKLRSLGDQRQGRSLSSVPFDLWVELSALSAWHLHSFDWSVH